ncbi:MAG: hypothetical protein QOI15_1431, partial [Pseudonocardiales bacterium]|nr:hypothetical protein [Pseudonocardiales bacterium]
RVGAPLATSDTLGDASWVALVTASLH